MPMRPAGKERARRETRTTCCWLADALCSAASLHLSGTGVVLTAEGLLDTRSRPQGDT